MKVISLLLMAAVLPQTGWAASARDGISAARAAAQLRESSFKLVEIEAFADEAGDIPCGKRSFSNTWKYKFYSRDAGWATVNACGRAVLNYAAHRPYNTSKEPVVEIPASFIDSAAAAEKVYGAGAVPGKRRESLMRFAYYEEAADRPAGFYWKVSKKRKAVYVNADGTRTWGEAPAASAPGKPSGGKLKYSKARDAAAKYYNVAVTEVRKKYPGAQLRMIEAIADKTGSAKCIDEQDGWWFIFYIPAMKTFASLTGCRNKTMHRGVDFEGRNAVGPLTEIPAVFKDSDRAVSNLPRSACSGLSSITMRLKNYRHGECPVPGSGFVWGISCGSMEHFVDARTGGYLGAVEK